MGWTNAGFITLEDLYLAYRKAKVDSFYERDQYHSSAFSHFEDSLESNLRGLLALLNAPTPTWMLGLEFVGGYSYLPKAVEPVTIGVTRPGTTFIHADADAAWRALAAAVPHRARFRLVGEHPVPFHVVSALWIQKVGHAYDAVLSKHAYAARVRRRRSTAGWPPPPSPASMGSFARYEYGYRAWRDNGIGAIRKSLGDGLAPLVVTADLKNFFHETSTDFLLHSGFLAEFGIALSADQATFTLQLAEAIQTWARNTPEHRNSPERGLPVGLSASRVISNVVLAGFDRFVERSLEPLYYGRYVDDVMLVVDNRRALTDAASVWAWIAGRSGGLLSSIDDDGQLSHRLDLPYSPASRFLFAGDKQKVLSLKGGHGEALLESIARTAAERSSDWRLLPDLPEQSRHLQTDFIAAGGDATNDVDSLRKADGLSVRRLAFALRLRNCEQVATDLSPSAWDSHRKEFFESVILNVLTVRGLFDYGSYYPRLVGLAVACGDWATGRALLLRLQHVFDEARLTTVHDSSALLACRNALLHACHEATLAATPRLQSRDTEGLTSLLETYAQLGQPTQSAEAALLNGGRLYATDLAREPFREAILDSGPYSPFVAPVVEITLPADVSETLNLDDAAEFMTSCHVGWSMRVRRATAFPTRPLSVSDITMLDQSSLTSPRRLNRWLRALRGWDTRTDAFNGSSADGDDATVAIPHRRGSARPTIALPSIATSDASYAASLSGTPDPDPGRYFRTIRIVNDVLRTTPPVDYLVMPELSLPRKWFNRFAHKLAMSNVSLIAGVDYLHHGGSHVSNQVRASLVTDQFGYSTPVMYVQEKHQAAINENVLLEKAGKSLRPTRPPSKPVLKHGAFRFAILICSELTNLSFRAPLRGKIDALFVPEWNQDTNSFSALVEASALDLHCFIVQVNNRSFGDSRVRAPFKDSFLRDVARARGGEADFFVVARLKVPELRAFQSGRPLPGAALFKPLPDGFERY